MKTNMALNKYFQAKYGLFTCYDARMKYGMIELDAALIERYEKPSKLRRVWSLAVMSCLYNKTLTWEEMEQYRIPYTRSKKYQKLMKQSKNHDSSLRMLRAKALKDDNDDRKSDIRLGAKKMQLPK